MKYFTIDRLKSAITHLSQFDSNWVIVPLVLASNGVNGATLTDVSKKERVGTTRFLDRFFSGSLIGLPEFENRRNVLRPKFLELRKNLASPDDFVLHQKANLWGSMYSSRGYREMRDRGELAGENSNFKVLPPFTAKWQVELPATFHFEELLVWLFAFKGFPDTVTSWALLFDHFQNEELSGTRFDAVFSTRFHVNGGVAWPSDLLDKRPIDEVFQRELLPSKFMVTTAPLEDLVQLVNAFVLKANSSEVGLRIDSRMMFRCASALAAKRFLILSGLAGSGKTKLAQAFARWLAPATKEGQPAAYAVVPVGADWTGNDNILGYPDGLDPTRYVTRPALDLIQRAAQAKNADIPHFLILDEMNLSHVERYFADLLSLIESGEATELYRPVADDDSHQQLRSGVEPLLRLTPNLFIIGTVNVDETTYMFSPKVLDRANVVEFRMAREELAAFLTAPRSPNMDALNGRGSGFGAAFVRESGKSVPVPDAVRSQFETEMLLFFDLLRDHNAEFGFRVVNEAARFLHFYRLLGGYPVDSVDWFNAAMDAVIVQKLLPKLHGSRPKLEGLLWALAWACGGDRTGLDAAAFLARCREAGNAQEETKYGPEKVEEALAGGAARYPLSFDKVMRMWRKLVRDQFVTFAEA